MAEQYNNDNEVKIRITAESNVKPGLSQAEKDLNNFRKTWDKMWSDLKQSFNKGTDYKPNWLFYDKKQTEKFKNDIRDSIRSGLEEGMSQGLSNSSKYFEKWREQQGKIFNAYNKDDFSKLSKHELYGYREYAEEKFKLAEAALKKGLEQYDKIRNEYQEKINELLEKTGSKDEEDLRSKLSKYANSFGNDNQEVLNDLDKYKQKLEEAQEALRSLKNEYKTSKGKSLEADDSVSLMETKDRIATRLLKGFAYKATNNTMISGMGRILSAVIDGLKAAGFSLAAISGILAGVIVAIRIISAIVNDMKKTIEFIKNAIKTILKTFKDMMVLGIKFLGLLSINAIKAFVNAIKGTTTVFKTIISLATKALASFTKIFSVFSISYSEGVSRLYQWAELNNNQLAGSLDTITSCCHAIENSLAAIVAPLFNRLAPIIDIITDKVLVLTNAIAKMMAQLSGASSYTKVTRAASKFADANEKAAKSLQKILLNIDELNKLEDKSGSGIEEVANSFEEVSVSLDKMSPFEIGAGFGKTLFDWLDSIDWTSIKQKAANIGQKLAEVINGIFSTEGLGRKIGDSLAEAVNTAFEFLDHFIDTINVKQIALQIAEIVNGFFDTTLWRDHGETIGKYIQGAFDFVYEFLTTLDTTAIGQSVAELFNGIFAKVDGASLGLTLSEVINTAFEIMDNFIKNFDVAEMTKDISNMITNLFKNIDFDQIDVTLSDLVKSITTSINTFLNDDERVEAVANAIYRLVKTALNTSVELITGIDWTKLAENIGKYMANAIKGLDAQKICDALKAVFEAAFALIINTPWAEMAKFAMDLFNCILTAIPEELAKVSPSEIGKKITEVLNIIIDDMNPQNISSAINSLIDWVGELWDNVKDGVKWKELVDKVTQAISEVDWAQAFEIVWEVWWKCWTFKNIFKGKIIFNLVADLVKDLKEKMEDKIQEITGIGEGVAKAIVAGIEYVLSMTNPFTALIYWANKVKKLISEIKGDVDDVNEKANVSSSGGGGTRRFASGGVVYQPTAAIVGEYAGASTNPEIITPENKMREVFAEGNNALANVYLLVGRLIIQAIENQDFNVSIGDDLIAKAAARGNNNYRRMTGASLII